MGVSSFLFRISNSSAPAAFPDGAALLLCRFNIYSPITLYSSVPLT